MASATPTFELNHPNAPLLAFIFDGFSRINHEVRQARKNADKDTLAVEMGTFDDRLLSAALMISATAVNHLQPAIDFYNNSGCEYVFVYDHLEYNESDGLKDCASLPAFIWRYLDADQSLWLLASEHLRPEELPMEKIIAEWRQQAGLI
jgi:hypothetical protein